MVILHEHHSKAINIYSAHMYLSSTINNLTYKCLMLIAVNQGCYIKKICFWSFKSLLYEEDLCFLPLKTEFKKIINSKNYKRCPHTHVPQPVYYFSSTTLPLTFPKTSTNSRSEPYKYFVYPFGKCVLRIAWCVLGIAICYRALLTIYTFTTWIYIVKKMQMVSNIDFDQ